MKKIKLLASLVCLPALAAGISTVVSCNDNGKIEITGVNHGTVEYTELKLNQQLIVTYKPQKGWKLDYAIITVGGKTLLPGTANDYMIDGNVITIFSKAITSKQIKIQIVEAKDESTKCAFLYQHLISETEQYFTWDGLSNPTSCEKTDKTTTIKLKKLKACDGKFSNPKIKAVSTVTISSAQSLDLSDTSFPVGATKTYTFTWTDRYPQDIAFFVYVDTILIKSIIPDIDKKVFHFIDLPQKINALDKSITIKFEFILPQTYKTTTISADFVSSPAIEPQSQEIQSSIGEQSATFNWSDTTPDMITFTLSHEN